MLRFFIVLAAIILSACMFLAEGALREGMPATFLGIPAVAFNPTNAHVPDTNNSDDSSDDIADELPPLDGWLTLGGTGVVTMGYGIGVVEIGLFGGGLLFATGQVSIGMISIGQAAFGLIFFIAQLGVGGSGIGQLAIGGSVAGQGALGGDGEDFLTRMSEDINELLRFWGSPAKDD